MITATEITLHNAGPLERIPCGEGRSLRIEGEEVAVFRTRQGEVYAVQATCPHRGGPLADGLVGGGTVVCPLHGNTFDLATGSAIRNPCPSLRVYPVSISAAGDVMIGFEAGGATQDG